MAKSRTPFRIIFENAIPTGPTIDTSAPIPAGEKWSIQRVIFGDPNIGDNKSGGFRVEFGAGGSYDVITMAWLTGDTKEILIAKQFEGDGSKHFRLIRQNTSVDPKHMFVIAEGFKRL